jgi:hypothetical protein
MKIKIQSLIVLGFSILMSTTAFSQRKIKPQPLPLVKYNTNVNAPLTAKELSQIKEVYGSEAEKEVLNRPQRVKDIKNILRNRVVIKQISGAELKPYPLLSEVTLFDAYVPTLKRDTEFNPKEFNPLKYNFNFYSTGAYMYRVDHTNYFIIIKSQHQ